MKLRRYLEGGSATLVVRALERYFDRVLEDGWKNRLSSKAKDSEGRAMALVRHYRDTVQTTHPNMDLEGLVSMFEHDRTHFGKMVASLLPVMNMLTSGTLGPLLSPDPNDIDDPRPITDSARIINQAQVAYIGLDSLSDGMVGSAIGSILLADLASVAGDRYNYGLDNRPVNIFKPDPLKQWRSRHTRESKTITVLETDWPGTLEVCRNAVDYIHQHLADEAFRDTAIEASLTAALDAYRSSVDPTFRTPFRNNLIYRD